MVSVAPVTTQPTPIIDKINAQCSNMNTSSRMNNSSNTSSKGASAEGKYSTTVVDLNSSDNAKEKKQTRLLNFPEKTHFNNSENDKGASAEGYLKTVVDSFSSDDANGKKQGGALKFPVKLHCVLSNKECNDAITWLPSGTMFRIADKKKFVDVIMPKYFKSKARFISFERRLEQWGFKKIDPRITKLHIFAHGTFTRDSQHEAEVVENNASSTIKQLLRTILNNDECQPFISWLPSGNSFCINHIDLFTKNVLHKYSHPNTSFKIFYDSLMDEGFRRVNITDFVDDPVYSHKMFLAGRPDLCTLMCRGQDPIPKKTKNGAKSSSQPASASSSDAKEVIVIDDAKPSGQDQIPKKAKTEAKVNNQSASASSSDAKEVLAIKDAKPSAKTSVPVPGHSMAIMNQGPFITHMNSTPSSSLRCDGVQHCMDYSNTMPRFQSQMMSHPSMMDNQSIDFRRFQGMDHPNAGAFQQRFFQSPPGFNSFATAQAIDRYNSAYAAWLHQTTNQGHIQAPIDRNSTIPQQSNADNSCPTSSAAESHPFAPNNGTEETAEDIKLAMLEVEGELLKLKEQKLLTMQQKMKVQLEMKRQKEG